MPTSRTFITLIPANWDPTDQLPHWLSISPDFTMPTGHVHFVQTAREDWTVAQTLQRGVTHWSRQGIGTEGGGEADFRAANPNNEYNDVPRTREVFPEAYPAVEGGPWWPNGIFTYNQAKARGESYTIGPRLCIFEFGEGDDYVEEGNGMWAGFYDGLIPRYEAQMVVDGIQFFVCHNYFTRFGSNQSIYQLGQSSQASQQALYTSDPSTWPATLYHPGGNLSKTNLVVIDFYFNDPQALPKRVYQALFHTELLKKMGYFVGLFWFDVHEWFPGFAGMVNLPGGTFERSDKAPLDPSLQLLIPVLAHEYGEVSVEWGIYPKTSTDKTRIAPFYIDGKDRYYPGGNQSNPQTYPDYAYSGNTYQTLAYLTDVPHFGIRAWQATGGQTVGGTNYYLRYRIDGGAWVEPVANKSDTVRAWYEQKWIVKARVLSGQMSICAFSLFADNLSHTLEYQHPTDSGITYTATVCGIKPHLDLITL
jgi:hypothetical protein